MRVIPVLDLLGGEVVRGVAGNRASYRPVESRIAPSSEPRDVARAFREHLGLTELYVADLDAILHLRPARDLYGALCADGFRLLVDCGVRSVEDATCALDAGASAVVIGLETLPGPAVVEALCRAHGNRRVIFSLDLMSGRCLGDITGWRTDEPVEIAAEAIAAGVRRMIVLDLARVGVAAGLGTLLLCGVLRDRYPGLEIITGGGVRGPADLTGLSAAALDGVLVASAFHSGDLTRRDVENLPRPGQSCRSALIGS